MPAATILEMPATDLIGRLVTNPHGAEFVVTTLTFDARTASVIIWIDLLDETSGEPAGHDCGIQSLEGWTIGNRI
jgi:hypothetical protein